MPQEVVHKPWVYVKEISVNTEQLQLIPVNPYAQSITIYKQADSQVIRVIQPLLHVRLVALGLVSQCVRMGKLIQGKLVIRHLL